MSLTFRKKRVATVNIEVHADSRAALVGLALRRPGASRVLVIAGRSRAAPALCAIPGDDRAAERGGEGDRAKNSRRKSQSKKSVGREKSSGTRLLANTVGRAPQTTTRKSGPGGGDDSSGSARELGRALRLRRDD